MSNTLDLELLKAEKQRLWEVVQAAVDIFYEKTKLIPSIDVSSTEIRVKCGVITTGPTVTININL